jgi:hypothetical protein
MIQCKSVCFELWCGDLISCEVVCFAEMDDELQRFDEGIEKYLTPLTVLAVRAKQLRVDLQWIQRSLCKALRNVIDRYPLENVTVRDLLQATNSNSTSLGFGTLITISRI